MTSTTTTISKNIPNIQYSEYQSELQLKNIIHLIENDLSEPYSVYTYRYFIHNWPNLCFLVKKKQFHFEAFLKN
jgi:peptide alpha-N-acetyltransferase